MLIAEKIKELREQKNISQRKLAKELKITNTVVSLWESGTRTPTFKKLSIIAEYFNVPINSFFECEDNNLIEHLKSPLESELNSFYKKLNYANQNKLLGYAESLLRRQEESAPGKKAENNFV